MTLTSARVQPWKERRPVPAPPSNLANDIHVEQLTASAASISPAPVILSSQQFIAGFVPPDYLVDRILQRRFAYSLTGPTGAGKTAISLLITASVAMKRAIGDH